MTAVTVVLAAALATALATGLGALPLALTRHPGTSRLGTANALAAERSASGSPSAAARRSVS